MANRVVCRYAGKVLYGIVRESTPSVSSTNRQEGEEGGLTP